jgi:hypothetical protein
MRAGLVLRVPRGAFGGKDDSDVVFIPAHEARGVAIPAVKKRLAKVDGVEVGIAVIDGRVVGYLDLAGGTLVDATCVIATVEGKGELALSGVEVLAAGRFPEANAGAGVTFDSRDIPAASAFVLAARIEERFTHSHREPKWTESGGRP